MSLQLPAPDAMVCDQCEGQIDTHSSKPLAKTRCTDCGAEVMVPGVLEHFHLKRVIGKGKSATVFKSWDTQLHRDVAVKVLTDEESAEGCIAKAQTIATINHSNIVAVFGIREFNGLKYVVMELVTGGSAGQFIQEDPRKRLSAHQAMDMMMGLVDGLNAAQKAGLIHMNLKPNSILLSKDQIPKLIDFASPPKGDEQKLIGTPYYIAPEAVIGQPHDIWTDMYSLGAVFYHLLSGKAPFTGSKRSEVMSQRLDRPATPIRHICEDLDVGLATIIDRLLSQESKDRFADYNKLESAVQMAMEADGDDDEPSSLDELADAFKNTQPQPNPKPVRSPDQGEASSSSLSRLKFWKKS